MSYILDALNKSDAERQREHAPNLKTVHRSARAHERKRFDLWQTLIIVLVLANAGLLVLWLFPGASEEVRERTRLQQEQAPTVSAPAMNDLGATSAPRPAATSNAPPVGPAGETVIEPDTTGEIIAPAPAGREVPAIDAATLPDIYQLPVAVQRQIPPLTFASHIYSSDPRSRLVSINGRLSREGDRVGNDLVLLAITEEGVVLEFEDYRFRMSILRDWSSE